MREADDDSPDPRATALLEDLQALCDRGLVQVDPASTDDQVRVALTARGRHEATETTALRLQPCHLRLVDKPRTDRSDPECA
jgi:hypothetical protein